MNTIISRGRGRSRQLDICWYEERASRNYLSNIIASPRPQDVDNQIQTQLQSQDMLHCTTQFILP